eukprot:scaffold2600_cov238-Pinguiococcus_pyrenoidosus.AAC.3
MFSTDHAKDRGRPPLFKVPDASTTVVGSSQRETTGSYKSTGTGTSGFRGSRTGVLKSPRPVQLRRQISPLSGRTEMVSPGASSESEPSSCSTRVKLFRQKHSSCLRAGLSRIAEQGKLEELDGTSFVRPMKPITTSSRVSAILAKSRKGNRESDGAMLSSRVGISDAYVGDSESTEGRSERASVGASETNAEGSPEGRILGGFDGAPLGGADSLRLGASDLACDGLLDSPREGTAEATTEGASERTTVGTPVILRDGASDATNDGDADATTVGISDRVWLG